MMQTLLNSRPWRLVMTALCFVLFGAGGLLLSLIGFPLLNLFIVKPEKKRLVARRCISYCFNFFINTLRYLSVINCQIIGKEILAQDQRCLIVANHPSLIDYVILASVMPTTDCIVKSSLKKNIFVKGVIRAADYLVNNQSDILLPECTRRFEKNETLIIFPEGTRTVYGEPLKLQRGAANIAVRCRVNIRLVHIECDERMLDKQSPWYRIPARKPTFTIRIGQLIDITSFIKNADAAEPSVVARQLNRYLQRQLTHSSH